MTTQVRVIESLRPGEKLMDMSREQFVMLIQRFCPQLTGHSFKKGAHDALIQLASAGMIEVDIIPVILKHQDKRTEFPVTTIGYGSEKTRAEYARAFKTGLATRYL